MEFFFFYFTDYGRVGTKLLLNYWIHGDKVEIGPNSLSHDYLCPMTIWGLIKRSHCLHDWSKNKKIKKINQMKIASLSWAATAFIYIFVRGVYPPLATPVRSTKLQKWVFFFKEWLTFTITGKEPSSGCADSCTPLSRIVWGCQSRTPPPHRHTHTQTNRHGTHTHFMPVPIARGYNRRNTSNHFVVSGIHNRYDYGKLLNSELCSHLLTCAAIKWSI